MAVTAVPQPVTRTSPTDTVATKRGGDSTNTRGTTQRSRSTQTFESPAQKPIVALTTPQHDVTLHAGRTRVVLDGEDSYRDDYLRKASLALDAIPKPTVADYANAAKGSVAAHAVIAKRREAEGAYAKLLKADVFWKHKQQLTDRLNGGNNFLAMAELALMGPEPEEVTYFDEAVLGADEVQQKKQEAAQADAEEAASAHEQLLYDSVCTRIGEYTLGPPTKPAIGHDNGMLQNPDDDNDPNPIAPVKPKLRDRMAFAEWKVIYVGARTAEHIPRVSRQIPDALDAYGWFRRGDGKPRTIDYERFIRNDPSGQQTVDKLKTDLEQFALQQYAAIIKAQPAKARETIVLQVTGPAVSAVSPETENWQKALGEHAVWTAAEVTIHPAANAKSAPTFEAKSEIYMEDRYNFNPGSSDIATAVPDNANGRFEQTGLAHAFMNYGKVERSWSFSPPAGRLTPDVKCEPPGDPGWED